MFNRSLEGNLQSVLNKSDWLHHLLATGSGLLTVILKWHSSDSRAAKSPFLTKDQVESSLSKVKQLNELAKKRGQKFSQLALAFNLRLPEVTSVLIGASRTEQIQDALGALQNLSFTSEELQLIDSILA